MDCFVLLPKVTTRWYEGGTLHFSLDYKNPPSMKEHRSGCLLLWKSTGILIRDIMHCNWTPFKEFWLRGKWFCLILFYFPWWLQPVGIKRESSSALTTFWKTQSKHKSLFWSRESCFTTLTEKNESGLFVQCTEERAPNTVQTCTVMHLRAEGHPLPWMILM